MRKAIRSKAAVAATTLLLSGCGIFLPGDVYLEGYVEGTVSAAGSGVGEATVSVYRTTAGCATCPDDRVNAVITGGTGAYRMHISIHEDDQDASRGFALVVIPPAATGLNGDTVAFTPRLNPNPLETVEVNVTLTPKP